MELHKRFFGLFCTEFLDEVSMKITQLKMETKNMSSMLFMSYFLFLLTVIVVSAGKLSVMKTKKKK